MPSLVGWWGAGESRRGASNRGEVQSSMPFARQPGREAFAASGFDTEVSALGAASAGIHRWTAPTSFELFATRSRFASDCVQHLVHLPAHEGSAMTQHSAGKGDAGWRKVAAEAGGGVPPAAPLQRFPRGARMGRASGKK